MNHLSVIGLGTTNDLFWPIRCEGRTAGVGVAGSSSDCSHHKLRLDFNEMDGQCRE